MKIWILFNKLYVSANDFCDILSKRAKFKIDLDQLIIKTRGTQILIKIYGYEYPRFLDESKIMFLGHMSLILIVLFVNIMN